MKTIIDGYNLVFQCGFNGKDSSPQDIERSRQRLLDALVQFMSQAERIQTTIVFDAKKLPINEANIRSRKQDVDVIFSVGYSDADTLIEEMIAAHSHPKSLVVVSSDHRIQTAASRRRAIPVDSDVWFDRLEKRQDEEGTSSAAGSVRSSGQPRSDSSSCELPVDAQATQEWLRIFADDELDLVIRAGSQDRMQAEKMSSSQPREDKDVDQAVPIPAADLPSQEVDRSKPTEPNADINLSSFDEQMQSFELDPELQSLMSEFDEEE